MDLKAFKKRVIEARLALGFSRSHISEQLGVKEMDIRAQEEGKIQPTYEYLLLLFSKGINANWLFSGKGDILLLSVLGPKLLIKKIRKFAKLNRNQLQTFLEAPQAQN